VQRAIAESANAAALSPIEIMHLLGKYSREITVVADTGSMAAWTGVLYPTLRSGSYFRAIGSLGWALPASLGVQLARSEKVVCVIGDGGAGYHIADIETAVRLSIPLVIVILNNSGLIFEYHLQKYRFEGNVVPEANDLSEVDYSAVAKALGAESARIMTSADFDKAFAKALETDKPTILDVVIDREAIPPVTNFEDVMERKI